MGDRPTHIVPPGPASGNGRSRIASDPRPASPEQVAVWLRKVHGPDALIELRVPGHRTGRRRCTMGGLYDDLGLLARDALALTPHAPAVYMTLNVVRPAGVADRPLNRCGPLTDGGGIGAAAIARRCWLLLDVDPKRPDGSATDGEKCAARAVLDAVLQDLRGRGWPEPVVADSGNGYHALYRVDLPPEDGGLVCRCLKALAARHDTPGAAVDTAVHDAPRVVKVYGTLARRGEHCPERPHRASGVLSAPDDEPGVVPRGLLEALAKDAPTPEPTRGKDYRPGAAGDGISVGDDFDQRGTLEEALGDCGAKLDGQRGDELRLTRPGKDGGTSATFAHNRGSKGEPLLKVFSSNWPGLEAGRNYGLFNLYAALHHNGDHSAAARELAGRGYGSPPRGPRHEDNGHHHDNGKPTGQGGGPADEPEDAAPVLNVASLATLERAGANTRWLWPQWIPIGVVTALAAEPGEGKTRLMADLVRRIRHGLPWPDGQEMAAPRDSLVLWVLADNQHDELVALGNDFGIKDAVMVNAWEGDPYGGVSLESAEDLRALEQRIRKCKPLLVIVDTVGNSTDRNLSRSEDARAFYLPLQVLARRHECAIACLTHLNAGGKFLGRRVLEKVRVGIRLDKPDPTDDRRSLEVTKTNKKKPPPLGVTMGDHGNDYDPDPPKAPEVLEPGMQAGQGAGKAAPRLEACKAWLRERLSHGKRRVAAVRRESEEKGVEFAPTTLYAAVASLGVIETGTRGSLWWELPASEANK